MKYLKNYVVPFSGLKIGKHHFEFELGPKFFACFEKSNIQEGKINADVVLDKQASMLIFNFSLNGVVKTLCDRCNAPMEINESGEFRLIVKFSNEEESISEEIVHIPEAEVEFDLSQYLYEFAHLLLPRKKVHEEGDCDAEMIELLEKMTHKNNKDDIDPRWEALKKLNN